MHISRSRPRDSKGKFISSSKFPTTFGLTITPITNPINRYAGVKKEQGGAKRKVASEREILNQDEEAIEQIIFGSTEGIALEKPVEMQDHTDL